MASSSRNHRTDTIFGNASCGKREQERNLMAHRERLKEVRPQVDNRPPAAQPHLTLYGRDYQAKKKATTEAAFSDLKMIQAIAKTMTRPFDGDKRGKGPVSLNATARKQEIFRIMSENHQLLTRIEGLKPVVCTKDLVRDHKDKARYVVNLSHTKRRI